LSPTCFELSGFILRETVVYPVMVRYVLRAEITIRIRWAGHVARMGEERGCLGSWWGSRRERDHRGGLGADGWIILGWISRR